MVKTVKIYGRKQKLKVLNNNDTIKKGDMMHYVGEDVTSFSDEEKWKYFNDRMFETLAVGELVKDHPERVYFRIV